MSLRSPMGVALGNGAAGGAAQHPWLQLVTAVALVPLMLWFLVSLLGLPSFEFVAVRAWLGSGWTPVWMILLVMCAVWHSMLGVQVIIEDYVPRKSVKTVALMLLNFLHAIAGVAAVFAVIKVALQSP